MRAQWSWRHFPSIIAIIFSKVMLELNFEVMRGMDWSKNSSRITIPHDRFAWQEYSEPFPSQPICLSGSRWQRQISSQNNSKHHYTMWPVYMGRMLDVIPRTDCTDTVWWSTQVCFQNNQISSLRHTSGMHDEDILETIPFTNHACVALGYRSRLASRAISGIAASCSRYTWRDTQNYSSHNTPPATVNSTGKLAFRITSSITTSCGRFA